MSVVLFIGTVKFNNRLEIMVGKLSFFVFMICIIQLCISFVTVSVFCLLLLNV